MQITIYTDGACDIHADNRPGGWAAIICATDGRGEVLKETVLSGGQEMTTNNQMELRAVIEGLKILHEPSNVTVVTDSRYVMDIATGINRASKNSELWRDYFEVAKIHQVAWKHVVGHSGDSYNERCDKLAVLERKKYALFKSEVTKFAATETDCSIAIVYLNSKEKKKPKRATWSAYLLIGDETEIMGGALNGKTFYEALLIGLIQILSKFPQGKSIIIYTVQENISRNLSQNIFHWMRNDWTYINAKTEEGDPLPVKYKQHWQELYQLTQTRTLKFENYKLLRENSHFRLAGYLAEWLLEKSE